MTGTLSKKFLNQKCEILHDLAPVCSLLLHFIFPGTISFWLLTFYQSITFAQIKFSAFKCFLTIAIAKHQILYFVHSLLWDVCAFTCVRCEGRTCHSLSVKVRGQLCGISSFSHSDAAQRSNSGVAGPPCWPLVLILPRTPLPPLFFSLIFYFA